MNAARKRRIELKKRIEVAKKARLEQEDRDYEEIGKLRCRHDKLLSQSCRECDNMISAMNAEYLKTPEVMEARLKQSLGLRKVRRAYVILKAGYLVTVWMSIHNPTQTIANMQKNGFWAPKDGLISYFTPDQIIEVVFDNE